MLAEALKFLTDLGRHAASVDVQQIDGDPNRVHFFNRQSGTHTTHPLPPAPRLHRVLDLAQFVAYAKAYHPLTADECPVCWVGEEEIQLILDDRHYRENRICMPLNLTPPAATLSAFEAQKTLLEPPALIRMLRLDLGLHDHPLIAGLRKVDWDMAKRTTSETDRGRESLGKTIEAKVGTVEEIPETTTVTVPIFEAASMRTIQCTVEIDAYQARVGLIPEPGQMRTIFLSALCEIAEILRRGLPEEIPVYLGSPE